MIVADVPLDEADLALYDGLDVAHDHVAVDEALEPGQLILIRTFDGVHHCAEVVGLEFTPTRTIYQLRIGLPVEKDVVRALTHRRAAPAVGERRRRRGDAGPVRCAVPERRRGASLTTGVPLAAGDGVAAILMRADVRTPSRERACA